MLFFFQNGKAAKVPLAAYATKTNRRRLLGAYGDKSPLVAALYLPEDGEVMLYSTAGRRLLVHTGAVPVKTTRSTQGVQVMTLRGRHTLERAVPFEPSMAVKPDRYRTKTLPAVGALPAAEDVGEQLTLE